MVYLYAGLGIVMISGITAMMQVANNVSNFNLISAIKTDKYVTADLAKHDRRFLKIINDPTAPKSDICKYIYSQIEIERLSLLNQGISSEQINKIAPIYLDSLSIDDKVVPYLWTQVTVTNGEESGDLNFRMYINGELQVNAVNSNYVCKE